MSETIENKSDTLSDGSENPWQKMADEVLAEKKQIESLDDTPESMEKSYFETEAEFSPDKIKEFREKLLNADEEQTKAIIESRIAFLEESCDRVDRISPSAFGQHVHRGYIGSNTNVEFQGGIVTMGSHYKLKDTGYLYEAVSFLQENKESVGNGAQLFNSMEGFLNSYFGIPDAAVGDKRMDIIEQKADLLNPELSDDEYFDAIDKIDISIFKGEHAAQCSERSAMAQNILSLFGYETYYINGAASIDGRKEDHAFNAIANNFGQKNIMDFSITSTMEYRGTNWVVPTPGKITDFDDFLRGGKTRTSTYEGHIDEDGNVSRKRARNIEYSVITK
ncbi:hypothetical protein IJI91_03140 [Candidatus Saccharibacteria bacterium]|nr:hypothetical protein [Candidatus Saccharibacteria bacterium]